MTDAEQPFRTPAAGNQPPVPGEQITPSSDTEFAAQPGAPAEQLPSGSDAAASSPATSYPPEADTETKRALYDRYSAVNPEHLAGMARATRRGFRRSYALLDRLAKDPPLTRPQRMVRGARRAISTVSPHARAARRDAPEVSIAPRTRDKIIGGLGRLALPLTRDPTLTGLSE
jgi:hypothetical protein